VAQSSSGGQSSRRRVRLVLTAGVLLGINTILVTLFSNSDQFMLASDVYLTAGETFLSGGDFYDVAPSGRPGYYFIYPPVIILLFVPHALLGSGLASFAIQTAVNLAVGVGTAVIIWRALARRGIETTRSDRLLITAVVLISTYGAIHLLNGQVTLWLGFAFAVGFDALDRGREELAGFAFACAALVKVFPAVAGLWLIRRRAWRGLAVAITTGVGGILLGLLVLGPDPTVTYFSDVLLGRYEGFVFDGAPDPSEGVGGSQRQLAALLGIDSSLTTPLSLAILTPLVLSLYRRVDTDLRRQAAILGTIVGMLLFLPIQPLYFPLIVFPLLLLLYQLPPGTTRAVVFFGTLFTFLRVGHKDVIMWLEYLPLPAAVETAVLDISHAVFTVILAPTVGLWLLLLGCLLVHWRNVAPVKTPDARGQIQDSAGSD